MSITVYWRGGFTIQGAEPVEVVEFASSELEAERAAEVAAGKAITNLKELGVSARIGLWTKKRSIEMITTEEEMVIFRTLGAQ